MTRGGEENRPASAIEVPEIGKVPGTNAWAVSFEFLSDRPIMQLTSSHLDTMEQLGRYEILEEIGQGGFAVVYLARDTQLGRDVALKELRPALLGDTAWVERFRREARAIARLDHPHIVPIYDIYELPNRLFLVMRRVNGPSLDQVIARRGYIPWPETLDIITVVADGLDYAHNQNILHRDLKPANILIDADRGPMLTDFGLAKLAGEHSMSLSASGSVVGTPHYIAPEVWEGKGSLPQSDVYGLACVLVEMLTGHRLFQGETAPMVMMAHFQPLVLPTAWPSNTPSGLDNVLTKALARHPANRYATPREMVTALTALSATTTTLPPIPAIPAPNDPPSVKQAKARLQSAAPVMESPAKPWQGRRWQGPSWQGPFWDNNNIAEADQEAMAQDTSSKWREFLTHVGTYIMVIGGLGIVNYFTSDYPWFLWPAIGWGIGLMIHLWVTLVDTRLTPGKWKDLAHHLGAYIAVIGGLAFMNLLSGSDSPWFLWPALAWGIALGIHLWITILEPDKQANHHQQHRSNRRQNRRGAPQAQPQATSTAQQPPLASTVLNTHLSKAKAYQSQIDALVNSTTNRQIQPHLQEVALQVRQWVAAIETLSRRLDNFQQNSLIHHDLASVPPAIKKLETQLATETDPTIHTELERTLTNRKNQLDALRHLENTMKRAELKIENTLSMLGTLYPQILTSQSASQVSDYSRIASAVSEEVKVLQDHLDALEEVKFGKIMP